MDKKQALSKAMALCSQREYNEAEIRSKLKLWGAEEGDIDKIMEELVKENFIDDLRFAVAYARDKVRLNHWGKIKVRYMLSMARVSHNIIDQALNEIDDEVYLDVLGELLKKKTRELKNESDTNLKRQKVVRFAVGRGFEMEQIIRVGNSLKLPTLDS